MRRSRLDGWPPCSKVPWQNRQVMRLRPCLPSKGVTDEAHGRAAQAARQEVLDTSRPKGQKEGGVPECLPLP
jgi:hypothetical protein